MTPNIPASDPLEVRIGLLLQQSGLKLAVAESCTGGLVCDRITDVPGSSAYFIGGVVAYAYEAKLKLLDIPWDSLQAHGAVDRETVLAMARGVRYALQTDLGLSVSGIAGPAGGMPGKPVGLTWIGLSAPDGEWARVFIWAGDRVQNKASSAQAALRLLYDYLQGERSLEMDDRAGRGE
jgi:PncC family amidohydrolase